MYFHMIKKNRFGENEIPFYTKRNYSTMLWYPATQEDIEEEHRAREEFEVVQNTVGAMYGGGGGGGKLNRAKQPPKKSRPPITGAEQEAALSSLSDMSALV
jgi:methylthioribose-1-phosphate isomerase